MNAWEFLMLWEVKILAKPAFPPSTRCKVSSQEDKGNSCPTPPPLSIWNDSEDEDERYFDDDPWLDDDVDSYASARRSGAVKGKSTGKYSSKHVRLQRR